MPASRAKRVILVGDGKQLPPFLESDLQDAEWLEANSLTKAEVNETLLIDWSFAFPRSRLPGSGLQYRMDKSIGDLVGRVFYPGALQSAPGAGSRRFRLHSSGLIETSFWCRQVESDRKEQDLEPGFANPGEARVIRGLCRAFLLRSARKRHEGFSIVVLAPAHRSDNCDRASDCRAATRQIDELSVHTTVHTYQGRQADIAIYSCVRTEDLGFSDP